MFQLLEVGSSQNVFAYHVKLQVYFITLLEVLEVGVGPGEGDDGDVEGGFLDVEGGEADAVDGDGAFFDDEGGMLEGELEFYFVAAVAVLDGSAEGGGVDVALDKMAVEAAGGEKAAFEVDV